MPLNIQPPEIEGDQDGEAGGKPVGRNLIVGVQHAADFVKESGEILAGADYADGAGEDVVEQQRRNRDARDERPHGVAHHDVHAAADEHGGAFEVDRAHREAEKHDAEDEPGGAGSDGVFGDAAGVEGR